MDIKKTSIYVWAQITGILAMAFFIGAFMSFAIAGSWRIYPLAIVLVIVGCLLFWSSVYLIKYLNQLAKKDGTELKEG